MAETACAATQQVANASTALLLSGGTAINAANTMVITPKGKLEKMLIVITNTTASQKVATIKAGANPPASESDADLAVTLAAGDTLATNAIVQLSSAKYIQSDGTVHITFAGSMTGFVKAIQLSKKA